MGLENDRLTQVFLMALRQSAECIKKGESDENGHGSSTQYTAKDGAVYCGTQQLGRISPALPHATEIVLEETGSQTPCGAVLADLRSYLTDRKSRTKSQTRLFNRRGLARFRFQRAIVRPHELEKAVVDRVLQLLAKNGL
jgi:hypothetical protein